jgi:hypothetical protein
MARFVIPIEDLPPVSSSAQHIVRFRVVSEDRNRISDYSPIFLLESPGQIPSASVEYVSTVSATTPKKIELTWSGGYVAGHTDLDPEPHDVFVKWSTSTIYQYVGRVVGNNFSIIAPASATNARFKVQVPSYPSVHPPDPDNDPRESAIIQILETEVILL